MMMNRSILTLLVGVMCLGSLAFGDEAPNAPKADACQYGNDNFLMGPETGTPKRLFRLVSDVSTARTEWQYEQILFCERPNQQGGYIIVTDRNRVRDVPSEILKIEGNGDYWTHVVINRAGKNHGRPEQFQENVAKSLEQRSLELVGSFIEVNGNPATIWVFTRNPNMIGGMPLMQAQLRQVWSAP